MTTTSSVDSAFEATFLPHTRLCFYPSSGEKVLWALMRLDCDLFVMAEQRRTAVSWARIQRNFEKRGLSVTLLHESADHLCFFSGGKTAWIFIEDNNVTLQRLAIAHRVIHHFVGICDGCCEGGNLECVHERPFLSRVLQLADQGMAYTTDHSRPLECGRPDHWTGGVPRHPKFSAQVAWHQFPEPPKSEQAGGPDNHALVCQTTRFELQAVLVAPHRQQGQKLKRADLEVLPIGSTPSQLQQLTPFRTLCGHGVLAEYRVVWDSGYKQLTETKGEH